MNELSNAEKQEIGRYANNRVKNSHLPIRRRERAMLLQADEELAEVRLREPSPPLGVV